MNNCQCPRNEEASNVQSQRFFPDHGDLETFSFNDLSLGAPIDVERLLDLCGEDVMLVSDVLDTFCVQGRDRVESLEISSQNFDFRQAVFDSVRFVEYKQTTNLFLTLSYIFNQMFILGAAKNVGADPLSQSVEEILEKLKSICGASSLADEIDDTASGKKPRSPSASLSTPPLRPNPLWWFQGDRRQMPQPGLPSLAPSGACGIASTRRSSARATPSSAGTSRAAAQPPPSTPRPGRDDRRATNRTWRWCFCRRRSSRAPRRSSSAASSARPARPASPPLPPRAGPAREEPDCAAADSRADGGCAAAQEPQFCSDH